MKSYQDIAVEQIGFVAVIEIRRGPHNFFDVALIRQIAEAMEAADADPTCRALVLASEGKSFCAGMHFEPGSGDPEDETRAIAQLYEQALRLFHINKPIVVAVHGPAIGGGLGLAMVGDFRVTCSEARFAANFTRLGFHPGFGLTATLPRLIGVNQTELLLYTSRRINGEEAVAIGLANVLTTQDQVRAQAIKLATEMAECGPLAVQSTRATLRHGLADLVRQATQHELSEQTRLRATNDFREGIKASAERRVPEFHGN